MARPSVRKPFGELPVRLLAITDLHDHPDAPGRILAVAPPVDLVLLGGDITNFGSHADAERVVRRVQQTGVPVLAVAGNCDSADIEECLAELGVSLFRRGEVRDGVGFHGLSGMPPWLRHMYQFPENELAAHLDEGYAAIEGARPHMVLSHPPPHGCKVDRTFLFRHVGSKALRTFIEERQPDVVVCGHIHEGRGVDRIGRTLVVNCGSGAAGYYAVIELGERITVDIRRA
jgi:Icc-related predicted phosphoesterase